MKKLDQVFGMFPILGNCGYTAGTLLWLPAVSGIWIWSLGAALAALPEDKTVALVSIVLVIFGVRTLLRMNRNEP